MSTLGGRRARTSISSSREAFDALTVLLHNPDDLRAQAVVATLAFSSSTGQQFVATVLNEFEVPDSQFAQVSCPAVPSYPCGQRETWSNYVGTQTSQPFSIECPESQADLQKAVQVASSRSLPIRAVGSHHAWSDAALTDGIVLETKSVLEPLSSADPTELRDPSTANLLRWIPAGMRICEINDMLDREGLALINMGGYDGQTLGGVISTSTHGSGIALPAFPGFVAALLVMSADGSLMQIEPLLGPTDPARYKGHGKNVPLRQDDNLFQATVVGIGCLGIIVGVLLHVRARYFLSEVRTIKKWSTLRSDLAAGKIIRDYRHVEVWINPHLINGDHSCLLTVRNEVAAPTGPTPAKPFRALFAEFLASLPGADKVLAWMFNTFYKASPRFIESALATLEDSDQYVQLSYKMLNIGATNNFAALSAEFGVDLDKHVAAADAMLNVAAAAQAQNTYHSGPIVLRYVAPSPGFFSMQPRETCMIELPLMRDVFGADSMIWRYEVLLTQQFMARPHWGQRNFVSGIDMLYKLYGQSNVDNWTKVFNYFNPHLEFASRFTDRVGLTSHAPSSGGRRLVE